MSLKITRRAMKLSILLLALSAGLVSAYAVPQLRKNAVDTVSVDDLATLAKNSDLYVHSGVEDGEISGNFYLADHPIDLDDVDAVSTRDQCGLTKEWKGIVWVSQTQFPYGTLSPSSIGGNRRVYGNVLVAGDKALINRVGALLQRQ